MEFWRNDSWSLEEFNRDLLAIKFEVYMANKITLIFEEYTFY